MTQAFKPIVEPTLIEALQALKSDVFKNLYCHVPGRIQSFDATKKTASIQLLFATQLPDGTIVTYPILADCPVYTPQGGGGAFQAPIASGDPCLVVFADRNIDAWFQNGAVAVPFDQAGAQPGRAHDLSDGMAFVGFNSLTDALPAYSADELRMIMGSSKVAISQATGLIQIKSTTTTLLVVLTGLIDVLKATTVQDGVTTLPLTATAIAALEAYKLVIEQVLY
jgi:hypothetical protein